MKTTVEPTRETDTLKINGADVPIRVWRGTTEGGCRVELIVLSVVPHEEDNERFKREVPSFMVPSRKIMDIGNNKKDRGDG